MCQKQGWVRTPQGVAVSSWGAAEPRAVRTSAVGSLLLLLLECLGSGYGVAGMGFLVGGGWVW